MADIEICLAAERKMWAALLEHDDGTPDFFDDLVRRTAAVVPRDRFFCPRWNADSAFTPSCWIGLNLNSYELPADLVDQWRVYGERWKRLLELNPRMKIADMLSDVSEGHDASSFPDGWEHWVRDWVRSGCTEEPSFYLGDLTGRRSWQAEFVNAAQAAGPGWVFYGDGPDVIYEWRWDDD